MNEYTLTQYGAMLADEERTLAYRDALRSVVRPDSVVLDIGCGTGAFAMMACLSGARRVFAVESSEVIELAQELAAQNGLSDRITFIRGLSTEISLPEPADILVSDIRGALPLFEKAVSTISDAKKRLLKPDAVIIPRQDRLWAALVDSPKLYERLISGPWKKNGCDLDMSGGQRYEANALHMARIAAGERIAEPQCWACLDYTRPVEPNQAADLHWTAERPGTVHGIGLWFDTELVPGIGFSNASNENSVYMHLFLPWPQPLSVAPGDEVRCHISWFLVGESYEWHVSSVVRHDGKEIARFEQSSLAGSLLSAKALARISEAAVPNLGSKGEVDACILQQMDGRHSLRKIAEIVQQRFPDAFPDWRAAMARVAKLANRYAK